MECVCQQVSQQALYRESRKCDTGSPCQPRSLHPTRSPPLPHPTSRRPAGALHARLRPGLAKLRAAPGRGAHPAQNSGAPPPRHLGPRGAFGLAAGPAGTGYGPIDASPPGASELGSDSPVAPSTPPPAAQQPFCPYSGLADAPAPLGPRKRAPLRRLHRGAGAVPPNFRNGQSLRPLIPTPAFVRLTSGASMPA